MKLELKRRWLTPNSTIGELTVDGTPECYTLEDVVRAGPKVPGKTAIPCGTYKVVVDYSNRFKKMMPHVLNVPGFEGIRIHAGNAAGDTEGCILVGQRRATDRILESRVAFDKLFAKLKESDAAELIIA